jgi:hypothetical protein
MPSLAFYPASFFQKLALSIMQTSDAASMPLLVLERIKCQGLAGTEWRTQFNHKCGSRRQKNTATKTGSGIYCFCKRALFC